MYLNRPKLNISINNAQNGFVVSNLDNNDKFIATHMQEVTHYCSKIIAEYENQIFEWKNDEKSQAIYMKNLSHQ